MGEDLYVVFFILNDVLNHVYVRESTLSQALYKFESDRRFPGAVAREIRIATPVEAQLHELSEQVLDLITTVDNEVYEERRSITLRQDLRTTCNMANRALNILDAIQPEINDDGEEEE